MTEYSMHPLISADRIAQRVRALGQTISRDYQGQKLCVIGVLKGSFIFMADLIRAIDIPCEIEFIGVSSYEGMHSTGHVRINYDLSVDIEGKHVLLVEDIIDTGNTIDYLLKTLEVRKPKSLKVACLLSKPEAHTIELVIDYTGFEISKEFVIGYGLDLDGLYRNLPELMQMLPKA
ncbi:MAG: hypoxanthine phosphoribosyltransferase [Pseudobdellovibrionaceae bacterium]|uniref:hypoxanthine phosphoribosyltransferase n=1 Tax=Oligoflexus sp. TaxID=1971216 RepID=UPI0027BBAE78|nr:hypoxanthine phosphoribosyltransferase [Oligoflexus sp.]MDQ3233133.1 hypoxanthine phosphoribosyltransferase [Pseudobdellovibrionaceae bacterium]HYX38734.1 hypoxanthine phosphoribosyltransferase [Oligoflexus sp.]